MAHIEKKIVKGHTYYYICQKGRVNGKPRNIWQKYLGSAEQILRMSEGGVLKKEDPVSADIAEFGSVAALLKIAKRMNLVEIIDQHIPEKARSMSVGDYMMLASINRCLAPTSKRQMADWYSGTSLPRLLGFKESQLTSQRFWDHMKLMTRERIRSIEKDLSAHMIHEFQLDLQCLLFDCTNFFTFIDTFTEGSLAQRGKNKQGRGDLRQIGLALLVTRDFHIPLFHQVYSGNQHDTKTFASITEQLVKRYKVFRESCEDITLVFDKGNNSEDNIDAMTDSPFHFVGSLVPTHFPDLLKIPLSKFKDATHATLSSFKYYRTRMKIFGHERTVVMTHNDNLLEKQLQSMGLIIAKARRKLLALQRRLKKARKSKKGRKPTRSGTLKQINSILSARHLKTLFKTELKKDRWGFDLTFKLQRNELTKLIHLQFGKKILFTDHEDWTEEQLILAYHAQAGIEEAFKRMKDPYYLCWKPQYHWTDSMIEVHGFYCVIALAMASLLQRELAKQNVKVSIPKMFKLLKDIREVALIYPKRKSHGRKPKNKKMQKEIADQRDRVVLSTMSSEQQRLFRILNLAKFQSVNATKS